MGLSFEEIDSPHLNLSDCEPALILQYTILALQVCEHVYSLTISRNIESVHICPWFASVLFIKGLE
jgi:hypothetical protein